MKRNDQDCPGVIARPPRLYLAFLVVGLALSYFWPAPPLPGAGTDRYAIGAGLIAAGALVMAVAMRQFRRAGTNVETHKPTTALVTDGLFGFSRNPIYVSLTLIYASVGVALNSAWILGLLIPLLAVMRYRVIAREEQYLERKFGDQYWQYRTSVRRWV